MTDSMDDYEHKSAMYEAYLEDRQIAIDKNAEKGFWVNIYDEKIYFKNIPESHRRNIIKYCNRRGLDAPYQLVEKGTK